SGNFGSSTPARVSLNSSLSSLIKVCISGLWRACFHHEHHLLPATETTESAVANDPGGPRTGSDLTCRRCRPQRRGKRKRKCLRRRWWSTQNPPTLPVSASGAHQPPLLQRGEGDPRLQSNHQPLPQLSVR